MIDSNAEEESFIRSLIIGAAGAALYSVLILATLVTALVSSNFNILQWLE